MKLITHGTEFWAQLSCVPMGRYVIYWGGEVDSWGFRGEGHQ